MSVKELKKWGDEAYRLLSKIRGHGSVKKKRTILALADAVYTAVSLNRVLKHNPDTASKTAHYKWLGNDPAYKAAYDYLIGDQAHDAPEEGRGLAWRAREAEFDEDTLVAVVKVERARTELDMLSLSAVRAYRDALGAEHQLISGSDPEHGPIIQTTPDHRTRLLAANAIADRISKLAKHSRTDLTSNEEKIETAVSIYLPENERDAND